MRIPEGWTAISVPHVARGEYATSLLNAADELGFDADVIKAQTDGFRVPVEVHRHLFPSQYAPAEPVIPEPVTPEPDPVIDIPLPEVVAEPEPEPTETVAEEIVKTSSPRAARAPRK